MDMNISNVQKRLNLVSEAPTLHFAIHLFRLDEVVNKLLKSCICTAPDKMQDNLVVFLADAIESIEQNVDAFVAGNLPKKQEV
jgi:hypothetical protein